MYVKRPEGFERLNNGFQGNSLRDDEKFLKVGYALRIKKPDLVQARANNAKELLSVVFGGLAVVVTGVTVDP